MTPELAEKLLRAMRMSIRGWGDQAEVIATLHPGCGDCSHLLAALRQAETTLGDLLKRDAGAG